MKQPPLLLASVISVYDAWSYSGHLVTMWGPHRLCLTSGHLALLQLSYGLSYLGWGLPFQAAGRILTGKYGPFSLPTSFLEEWRWVGMTQKGSSSPLSSKA